MRLGWPQHPYRRLGIALLVLCALFIVGAVWRWALVGMSQDVGVAWTVTVWVVAVVGIIAVAT